MFIVDAGASLALTGITVQDGVAARSTGPPEPMERTAWMARMARWDPMEAMGRTADRHAEHGGDLGVRRG